MNEMGKRKLARELEKFVVTRLRPLSECPCVYDYTILEDAFPDAKSRLQEADEKWHQYNHRHWTSPDELVDFSQLTNHEICHEMFWNAFRGRSKLYIQMQDLRFDNDAFSHQEDEAAVSNRRNKEAKREVMTLQCSLLTLQMLNYDFMMFRAMGDMEDEGYREAAQRHYRPYFFSYVAEIDREKYKGLKKLQENCAELNRYSLDGEEQPPYLWFSCTFNPDVSVPHVDLSGYVVQSASNIEKIRADLKIIADEKTPRSTVNSILDSYKLQKSCIKDGDSFIRSIEGELGHAPLSTIDVYKIGNGNCVFGQSLKSGVSFFYDIGYNYRHLPQKIVPGVRYAYSSTMKEICKKNPSLVILSHWDMDHIAGSAAAKKSIFDINWFAPNCYDACLDAIRLAKYLNLKDHLFLVERHSRRKWSSHQIDIKNSPASVTPQAIYRLYVGKKDKCDSSRRNCEGIVIEYIDISTAKSVVMMGDVNYSSFNKARSETGEPLFADTQIDYLVVPHHGSVHTDYYRITENRNVIKKGIKAIICCTNDPDTDRPNCEHRKELEKRFEVCTTEEIKPSPTNAGVSITITF